MGKIAPAQVSYRDDFRDFVSCLHDDWVISYNVYMKTESKSQIWPTCTLKLTRPSWIDINYACATRSSLPANQFHTETSGRFAFT